MVVETKENLRSRYFKLRSELDKDEIERMSRSISEKILNLYEYKTSKIIMAYYPFNNEVDTRRIIMESLVKKKVLLPVTDTEKGRIIPVEVRDLDRLKRGSFGIMEPDGKEFLDRDKIDIVLVPGIVFDLRGYRIGYGKGFYDRFLRNLSAIKIGLAYDFQVIDRIPMGKRDTPVDMIVTERRAINCNSTNNLL